MTSETADRGAAKPKGHLGLLLKIAMTLLVLGLIGWQLNIALLVETLSTISVAAVIAALIVALLQSFLSAQRLVMIVARFGVRFRLPESFRVTLEGMFFSQTFISFLGGDALRIWRIRRLGLPLTEATSAIVLDRLIGILVNHVLLLASLPWLLATIADNIVKLVLIFLALSGVGGFGLILLIAALRGRGGLLHRLRARIPFRRVATLLVEASSVGRHFFMQYGQLAGILLVSSVIAAANMGIFALILIGMGVDVSLAFGCALLVPAVLEIAMLPISIAGWGVREGAAVVAFGTLGLPAHQALGASFAFGLIVLTISLIGGLLWLTSRSKGARTSPEKETAQSSRAE